MPLNFPTIAEQVATEFRDATTTVSMLAVASQHDVTITRECGATHYRFDDDTTLVVRGRGASHKVETYLP